MQRSRAVHACGALRLVGGCTLRYNNVRGVTAGQAPHNSNNVGVVTAGQVGHNSCHTNVVTSLSITYSIGQLADVMSMVELIGTAWSSVC